MGFEKGGDVANPERLMLKNDIVENETDTHTRVTHYADERRLLTPAKTRCVPFREGEAPAEPQEASRAARQEPRPPRRMTLKRTLKIQVSMATLKSV
jgi:hypothetical protein